MQMADAPGSIVYYFKNINDKGKIKIPETFFRSVTPETAKQGKLKFQS